jgi:hypothetical protein
MPRVPPAFWGGGKLERLCSSMRSKTDRGLTPEEKDARSMLMRARPSVEQKGTLENPSNKAAYPALTKSPHKTFIAPDGSPLAEDREHQIIHDKSHKVST